MTEPSPISLVCLDLAGTVIDDSVVERAYAEAIATQGLVPGTQDYVRSMVRFDRSRGRPPAAVIRELFETDELRAQVATLAFNRSFRAAAQRFDVSVPAVVADAIGKAAGSGAQVALVTVLSRSACEDLIGGLRGADLVLCADDVPRSFPWPDPVLTAMLQFGTVDVREVAVVSATEDGVLSGYRAGAGLVVGIAGGARPAEALREAGATHVVDSIAAFSELLV
jgi:phosphonatase-like hydrolase